MNILDVLFPKYCVSCRKIGAYICSECFATLSFSVSYVCAFCNHASFDGMTHPNCRGRYTLDGIIASLMYTKVVKKLVYVFKYNPYVSHLETVLVDLFYEGLIQNERFMDAMKTPLLFVPIPLHKHKFQQRGYNQAALLAKGLSQKLGKEMQDILSRDKETISQFGLLHDERRTNMKDAFSLKIGSQKLLQNRTIFLIDDITTTGTTFLEAASLLKRKGVKKVYGIALARG